MPDWKDRQAEEETIDASAADREDTKKLKAVDFDPSLYGEELAPGAKAGEYVILERVGRGGCGVVYAAEHPLIKRKSAIKVLHKDLSHSTVSVKRFAREAMAASRIRHPNIVEIFDFGTLPDGRPYYLMEFLEGPTLSAMIKSEGRLSLERLAPIVEQMGAALRAAHAAGIVHRDVKLSNVVCMPGKNGVEVKLVDFGTAKLLRPEPGDEGLSAAGAIIGTPYAMAPEQIRGTEVDGRTDIYSLGVLLYYVLTGEAPFRAGSRPELERMHLEAPAPRPSAIAPISPALDAVVMKAMEKTPERRFQTMDAFLEAWRAVVTPTAAVETGPGDRAAVAICVEARTADGAEMDDALADDLMNVVDAAEHSLSGAGFQPLVNTGGSVLGGRPLPPSADEAREAAAAAVALARKLHAELVKRAGADPRVHVNVSVHAGSAVVTGAGDAEHIEGGAVTKMGDWVPKRAEDEVFVTDAARGKVAR